MLFPQWAPIQKINGAVAALAREAAQFDLGFEPQTLTHQLVVEAGLADWDDDASNGQLAQVCATAMQHQGLVACDFSTYQHPLEGEISAGSKVRFSLEFEAEFPLQNVEIATPQSALALLRDASGDDAASSVIEWDITEQASGEEVTTMLEGALLGTDAVVFLALQELGQAEEHFQNAIEGEGVQVVILPENDFEDDADLGLATSSAGVADHSVGRSVERSAPVYRGLQGFGHDPYCSDPYLDPYNPYVWWRTCSVCHGV